METNFFTSSAPSWIFGSFVLVISGLNFMLVHPVPGVAYFFLACLYLPPANALLKKWFDFNLPLFGKVFLGVLIILFTFGVSDLGDMIDKL